MHPRTSNLETLDKRFYFIKDLENIIGRNRLTLRRWWTAGKFPEPIKLNGITLAWDAISIDAWCNKQLHQKEQR